MKIGELSRHGNQRGVDIARKLGYKGGGATTHILKRMEKNLPKISPKSNEPPHRNMNSSICIAAISLLAWMGIANAEEVHLVVPITAAKETLSPAGMQARVASAAREYQKYGQLPRVALFDIAYPKDIEELNRTRGFGVMLTKLSQKQAEYLGVPVEGPYKADHYRY